MVDDLIVHNDFVLTVVEEWNRNAPVDVRTDAPLVECRQLLNYVDVVRLLNLLTLLQLLLVLMSLFRRLEIELWMELHLLEVVEADRLELVRDVHHPVGM